MEEEVLEVVEEVEEVLLLRQWPQTSGMTVLVALTFTVAVHTHGREPEHRCVQRTECPYYRTGVQRALRGGGRGSDCTSGGAGACNGSIARMRQLCKHST